MLTGMVCCSCRSDRHNNRHEEYDNDDNYGSYDKDNSYDKKDEYDGYKVSWI